MTNGPFQVSLVGTGGPEFRIMPNGRVLIGPGSANVFDLQPNGNLTIDGALTESSDRNKKENFGEIDSQDILKKLVELPLSTWNYKSDDDSTRHLGPMAQDFYASFELGKNETTIARIDTAGVTIAQHPGTPSKQPRIGISTGNSCQKTMNHYLERSRN